MADKTTTEVKWKKYLLPAVIAVIMILAVLYSQRANGTASNEPKNPWEGITITIDEPSDYNLPMPEGRHFYVSGQITAGTPEVNDGTLPFMAHFRVTEEELQGNLIPDDAVLTMELLDQEGNVVRHTVQTRKNNMDMYLLHPSFEYPDEDADPERENLKDLGLCEVRLSDPSRPDETFLDATSKSFFTDSYYRTMVVYATDQEHGLLMDDGVGYTDENGNPYSALGEGNYTVKVRLETKDGTEIASAEKPMRIHNPSDALLGRFHPLDQLVRILAWAKENKIDRDFDWNPGYCPALGNEMNGKKSGFISMFRVSDLALYHTARTHMWTYCMSESSSSYSLELAYLQYLGVVDDENRFIAYGYDIGEPKLTLSDGTVLEGKLLPYEHGDHLMMNRVDLVSDDAQENVFRENGSALLSSDTDLSDGAVIPEDARFAIMGTFSPFQLDAKDIVYDPADNHFETNNRISTVVYTFEGEGETNTFEREVALLRTDFASTSSSYDSELEFYNLFSADDLKPHQTYKVTVQGVDRHGTPIQGASESFELTLQ